MALNGKDLKEIKTQNAYNVLASFSDELNCSKEEIEKLSKNINLNDGFEVMDTKSI